MPILVIIGLLMGGSASFAAENTVPGDVLYPVKVHVNENVRGIVTVTSKAKAEWEVRLVERRLEEVEKLATTPNVLPEVQQIAQTNLAQYTDRVKEHIAKFDEENDSEDALATAGNLADILRTHEGVLAGLSTHVAGVMATSTAAVAAPSSVVAATSTAAVADTQSLATILAQLRVDRGDAEKKHSDLEHKYHPETQKINEDKVDRGMDESEEFVPINWTPSSVTNATVGTAGAITGTSTSAAQTVAPIIFLENRDTVSGRNDNEEIRATPIISTVPVATAPAVSPAVVSTTEHVESHTETQKTSESSKPKEND